MVNCIAITRNQAKNEVRLYQKVQKFWIRSFGKPEAAAIINGLPFTPFTASRFLTLYGTSVARYLKNQTEVKPGPLCSKGILENRELQ